MAVFRCFDGWVVFLGVCVGGFVGVLRSRLGRWGGFGSRGFETCCWQPTKTNTTPPNWCGGGCGRRGCLFGWCGVVERGWGVQGFVGVGWGGGWVVGGGGGGVVGRLGHCLWGGGGGRGDPPTTKVCGGGRGRSLWGEGRRSPR